MFYCACMRFEYREEPCRSALNRVRGMPFAWSLNPYTGCAHRCTFCYVRSFEARAERPSDDNYGRSIRVKVNVADVLRRELARPSWKREAVAIGAATDPYQPAEGRYRLTRACIRELGSARDAVLADHARPDDPCATSTCSSRRRGVRRSTSASRCQRSTSASGAAPSPERRRPGEGSTRSGSSRTPGSTPASRSRRCCLGSPTIRRCSPTSFARPAQPGRAASGRTSSTSGPAPASTFSKRSRATGRELLPLYERLYEGRAYLPARDADHVRSTVRRLAGGAWRPRRPPIRPDPEPEQLVLTV